MKRDKSKSGKGKTPPPAPPDGASLEEMLRHQRRVAEIRDKLRAAMDNPDKRQQMVDAIRTMMRNGEDA